MPKARWSRSKSRRQEGKEYSLFKFFRHTLLFYEYECFAYIYVSIPHASLVPMELRRTCQIYWDQSYRWLGVAMWELRIEPGYSGRATSISLWANLPTWERILYLNRNSIRNTRQKEQELRPSGTWRSHFPQRILFASGSSSSNTWQSILGHDLVTLLSQVSGVSYCKFTRASQVQPSQNG